MDIFSNLQNLLGAVEGGDPRARGGMPAGGASGSGGMLSPEMLGGLATALLGGKAGGAGLGGGGSGALGGLLGSLLGGGAGGGGLLNSALGGLLGGGGTAGGADGLTAGAPGGRAAPASASASDRELRVLRALVYAAKADGRVGPEEQAGIDSQIAKLGLGERGKAIVNGIMAEPLDPNRIASGVADANEAVGLYALSCAITDMDHFMERGYLDALATALRLPADAKAHIEAKVRGR